MEDETQEEQGVETKEELREEIMDLVQRKWRAMNKLEELEKLEQEEEAEPQEPEKNPLMRRL